MAVVKVWLIVALAALVAPHVLTVFVALAVVYSAAAPFLRKHLQRDIDRRTIGANDAARASFGQMR